MTDGETPQNVSLTLGFFGDQEVHRANMRENLEDFIEGYFKKSHRNAFVRCIICVDPLTGTMNDIADWALTSGYHLGLIGHSDAFETEEVAQLVPNAEGMVIRLDDDSVIERVLAITLSKFDEARLVLVADPNEDDDAYNAFVIARDRGVKVKSLLQGMDRVIMDIDDDGDEEQALHLVENDDVEDDVDDEDDVAVGIDDDDDDDDIEDRGEIDLDQLASAADEGDKEAAEELQELAQADGVDSVQYDTWSEVVVAMRQGPKEGATDDEGYYDAEADAEAAEAIADAIEVDVTAEESEQTAVTEPGPEPDDEKEEPPVATKTQYTRKQLERILNKGGPSANFPAIKQIALELGLEVGRGKKGVVLITDILNYQDGVAPTKRPAKKAPAKKKPRLVRVGAAKKAAATKKTAPTSRFKKKAAPAKKAPAKRTAPVRTPAATAASSNGQVDKAALRHFIKTARAALDVAESLM